MEKQEIVKGYAAFTSDGKVLGRGLNEFVIPPTDNIDAVYITEDKEFLRKCCDWYNACHKNQIEFSIEEVIFTRKIELKKIENVEGRKVLYV